ncbi:hypothetical protein A2555_00410 [Candidatus Falkowbacteria bacterium RIFOXYD2_FULL_39_16]|nr:MAG: hypothetical protein A2555_00410 [Candidatus Falkowbacteria bacterium RIFOXYD2_FULL_39_16]
METPTWIMAIASIISIPISIGALMISYQSSKKSDKATARINKWELNNQRNGGIVARGCLFEKCGTGIKQENNTK